jgi:hypothetical protein
MAGKKVEDLDLLGPNKLTTNGVFPVQGGLVCGTWVLGSTVPEACVQREGRECDQRWGMAPTLQHFSESEYFEHKWARNTLNWGSFK